MSFINDPVEIKHKKSRDNLLWIISIDACACNPALDADLEIAR
jgi:hypothetical protein